MHNLAEPECRLKILINRKVQNLIVPSSVCIDLKAGPDASVHSPFTKRQPYPSSGSASMMDAFMQDKAAPPLTPAASPLPKPGAPGQQVSPGSADPHGSSSLPLQQQQKLKQQKKRASISTKVSAGVRR